MMCAGWIRFRDEHRRTQHAGLCRYGETERCRGLQIDHQLETGWLQNRQICGFVRPGLNISGNISA